MHSDLLHSAQELPFCMPLSCPLDWLKLVMRSSFITIVFMVVNLFRLSYYASNVLNWQDGMIDWLVIIWRNNSRFCMIVYGFNLIGSTSSYHRRTSTEHRPLRRCSRTDRSCVILIHRVPASCIRLSLHLIGGRKPIWWIS